MEALKQTGFNEAAQRQGWSLVLTAYAATRPVVTSIVKAPLTEATDKIEAWQGSMFVRAHAALRRFHAEQDAFVFTNLKTGSGIAAVPVVATFLDRLDALESGPERKSTRKLDHAALDALAARHSFARERPLKNWPGDQPRARPGQAEKSKTPGNSIGTCVAMAEAA